MQHKVLFQNAKINVVDFGAPAKQLKLSTQAIDVAYPF